jgi:23S rRNA (adenine2503-C2)-methyltransferase
MVWDSVERRDSSEGNVWKYIFTKADAIVEAVLYRYNSFEERTVICCSVQSGCPVGCLFCGTGAHFIRNLTTEEIVSQVEYILRDMDIQAVFEWKGKKTQIMFMSMGEPMLNWSNVRNSISQLRQHSVCSDNRTQFLISTIGINDSHVFQDIIRYSRLGCPELGLQFSIHRSTDEARSKLIPYENKMNLRQIRDCGIEWWLATGRPVFLNYCIDPSNQTPEDFERLVTLFPPQMFYFTFSVVCSKNETMKSAGYHHIDRIQEIASIFTQQGYNTRVFDPAGQDDIGGGCGQLFGVQKWLKEHVAIS